MRSAAVAGTKSTYPVNSISHRSGLCSMLASRPMKYCVCYRSARARWTSAWKRAPLRQSCTGETNYSFCVFPLLLPPPSLLPATICAHALVRVCVFHSEHAHPGARSQ